MIGMPFELSGRIGHRAQRVQEFIAALRERSATVELHEQDERFTTAEATRVLIDADMSRAAPQAGDRSASRCPHPPDLAGLRKRRAVNVDPRMSEARLPMSALAAS